jgi:hypothetical protein
VELGEKQVVISILLIQAISVFILGGPSIHTQNYFDAIFRVDYGFGITKNGTRVSHWCRSIFLVF